jgi:hypothetical protein
MVEADSHLKLLLASILDIYKVFGHIDILFIGIQYQPFKVIAILLGSDFSVLSDLWSQNNVIMSWWRLTAMSNCFLHPYETYTKCLSILICFPQAYGSSLTQFFSPNFVQILAFWVTCEVKMM